MDTLVSSAPAITVLMPVYNGQAYLRDACESILRQSFSDFEFLILDDGSQDQGAAILKSYRDPRLRVVFRRKNLGLVATLNQGLGLARGRYIARMDCDDIAAKDRLRLQYRFLEKHPEIGVVASFVRAFGEGKSRRLRFPEGHAELEAAALFDSPLTHPSVMFRSSLLRERETPFRKSYLHAEDYELWSRWMRRGVRFQVLRRYLLNYRVHPGQIHSRQRPIQIRSADRVRLRWLGDLGLKPKRDELAFHRALAWGESGHDRAFAASVRDWMKRLVTANEEKKLLESRAFRRLLSDRWLSFLLNNRHLGLWGIRQFLGSGLPLRALHPKVWYFFLRTAFFPQSSVLASASSRRGVR